MRRSLAALSLSILLPLCASAEDAKLPKDIAWVTTSVEYAALCRQVYRQAWEAVERAAAATKGDFAVVLDLDETVLDNSTYQKEMAAAGKGFSYETWNAWLEREEAGAVPGAKRFLDRVRGLGSRARLVYITNRGAEYDKNTVANMKKLGLWGEADLLLARQDREDKKPVRRACVTEGSGRCKKNGPMPIVALLGDNVNDFYEVKGADAAKALRAGKLAAETEWGTRYFVLPNPMYGAWERDYK